MTALQHLAAISPRRMERFLLDVANRGHAPMHYVLPEIFGDSSLEERLSTLPKADFSGLEKLLEKYADLLPVDQLRAFARQQSSKQLAAEHKSPDYERIVVLGQLLAFAAQLRTAWEAKDTRTRDWNIFNLRRLLWVTQLGTEREFLVPYEPPPPDWPFEQAMMFFLSKGDKVLRCGNRACPAPFFFGNRASQKYCGPDCANPAQQAAKNKWWEEHGDDYRKKQRSSKSSTKGKRREK